MTPILVLASSSPYRQALLARLGLTFITHTPDVDESPLPGESPHDLAIRLSRLKAEAVGKTLGTDQPRVIIGSDQVAELGGRAIGKPGTEADALKQLTAASGHCVNFHTGLCVLSVNTNLVNSQIGCVTTKVQFRKLSQTQIGNYLKKEDALDCAGSFKAEGLGITLFESLVSDDPTALIGLPLILLTSFLRKAGIEPLHL